MVTSYLKTILLRLSLGQVELKLEEERWIKSPMTAETTANNNTDDASAVTSLRPAKTFVTNE